MFIFWKWSIIWDDTLKFLLIITGIYNIESSLPVEKSTCGNLSFITISRLVNPSLSLMFRLAPCWNITYKPHFQLCLTPYFYIYISLVSRNLCFTSLALHFDNQAINKDFRSMFVIFLVRLFMYFSSDFRNLKFYIKSSKRGVQYMFKIDIPRYFKNDIVSRTYQTMPTRV